MAPFAGRSWVAASCGAANFPPAPRASTLRLLPQMKVDRSVSGPGYNDVRRHFRYMILAGQHGTTSEALLRAEVALLTRDGWHLQPTTYVNNANQTTTVGLRQHGAVVVLLGPRGMYVALEYLKGVGDLTREGESPTGPGPPTRLYREIRDGVPMLSAVLGHRD